MITTARGVVLGRTAVPQRAVENGIVQLALGQLGINPFMTIIAPGTLEGGDFLPAGNLVFIGQGVRTNEAAIRQLMSGDAFRLPNGQRPQVVVVKDPWRRQEEMHLDTYFNIIDSDLAVLVDDRIPNGGGLCPVANKCPLADLWIYNGTTYTRQRIDVPFHTLLREYRYEVLPVSKPDQLTYGINFLTLGKREILIDRSISQAYKDNLQRLGVKTHWVDFMNLKMGYGAAHCTTQVLLRNP